MGAGAARAHMRKLKKYHTNRFKRIMRWHLGVRVDFMSDAAISPILEQGIRDNVDLIKTIQPAYHNSLKTDLLKLGNVRGRGWRAPLRQVL